MAPADFPVVSILPFIIDLGDSVNIMLVITKGKGKIATSILIFKCIHSVGM